ncbi:hypothetical protein NYR90_19560 [Clostridioides difficile]|nr:hypothetical protein NYR90_19560 [Clostridioides difficile]
MLFCIENIKTYLYVLFLVFARLGGLFIEKINGYGEHGFFPVFGGKL